MGSIRFAAALVAVLLVSAPANALDVDVAVKLLNNANPDDPVDPAAPPPILQAVARYHGVRMDVYGQQTVRFVVQDPDTHDVLLDRSSTIVAGQTEVSTGSRALGKITLEYDPATDDLVATFAWKHGASGCPHFDLTVHGVRNFVSTATMQTCFIS